MRVDPLKLAKKIKIPEVRNRLLDKIMSFAVPFNRGLGLKIKKFDANEMQVILPARRARQNHVGSAHACSLALLGEYCAGVLIAENFPFEKYRMIIGELQIQYSKQGRGPLLGQALAPQKWPELIDGEAWVEMQTRITNEKAEEIAVCKTKWQIKEWDKVR